MTTSRIRRLAFCAAVSIGAIHQAPAVHASPIIYTFEGIGTGTIGGTPFTDTHFTIRLEGDTLGIVHTTVPDMYQVRVTGRITISGIGSADYSPTTPDMNPLGVSCWLEVLAIGVGDYELGLTPTHQIAVADESISTCELGYTAPEILLGLGENRPYGTSRGDLLFTRVSRITYSALPPPMEIPVAGSPWTLALLSAGMTSLAFCSLAFGWRGR